MPSIPLDNFNYQQALVFDLTKLQDASQNCQYRELDPKPLKRDLNMFFFPLPHLTELNTLRKRMSSAATEIFGVAGLKI